MKKHLLILSLFAVTNILFAQPTSDPTGLTPAVQPPTIVMTSFSSSYPNTKPTWKMKDDDIYSAEYRDVNTNMGKIITYDNNGNILSTENELHNDAYPVAIAKYYIKKYPGEKYAAWSYENEKEKAYYVNREEETVWFNADGTHRQTVKKKNPLVTKKS